MLRRNTWECFRRPHRVPVEFWGMQASNGFNKPLTLNEGVKAQPEAARVYGLRAWGSEKA